MSAEPPTTTFLFGRLGPDHPSRAAAADQFYNAYFRVVLRYARQLGLTANEAEELALEVLGDFLTNARFAYDPAKGRFRGYLRTCVDNAIRKRAERRRGRPAVVGLDEVDLEEQQRSLHWDAACQERLVELALEQLRREFSATETMRRDLEIFESLTIRQISVAELMEWQNLKRSAVDNAKHRVSKRFREIVKELDELW
jgi:DNA-directed RNA polymerase specialized sigma24 family protein